MWHRVAILAGMSLAIPTAVVARLSARSAAGPGAAAGERKINIAVISTGFGGGKEGAKWLHLKEQADFALHMIEVPEYDLSLKYSPMGT